MSDEHIPEPACRQLRIFAFDPSVASQSDMAELAAITIPVRWEDKLEPGPVGAYVEVVDADPASGVFYAPVDLNDRRILAQDGLPPSETNPQFHQQMVYAVAMATIANFERALGRVALWSSHRSVDHTREQFVRRLRIYPHALRERNAYYSPDKKALLFGYFPVGLKDQFNTPGTLVFTCLSHDIVAHETTHALLDGVHPRFNEPVNIDVLAFHEAFADIVAMFQHFTYPGVIRTQIVRTRGDLAGENLLSQLAQQFGRATGRGRALRDALGAVDPVTNTWKRTPPDVHALERTAEPHARGAILVAAIFGAFLTVYTARTRDLYRIASDGTGVLREGDIHPDLAGRLAEEARLVADRVLQMCIRAIDYCPPVGITFGDYLRGIVTGDYEANREDSDGYRLAFIESFRQWGIFPPGLRSMSIDSLLWPALSAIEADEGLRLDGREFKSLLDIAETVDDDGNHHRFIPWTLDSDPYETWRGADENAYALWVWLMRENREALRPLLGIISRSSDQRPRHTISRSRKKDDFAVEVHSVRRLTRRSARGAPISELVVEITQRRRGYFDPKQQASEDAGTSKKAKHQGPKQTRQADFIYRCGCTLFINPDTMRVNRVIRTPSTIDDDDALERLRRFLCDGGLEATNAFWPASSALTDREPFALLHRHEEA